MNSPPENNGQDFSNLMQLFAYTDSLIRRFHQRKYRRQGFAVDPHHGQGKILRVLRERPGAGQNRLAELLGIRQQSLGELLGKLEKGGYITRAPAADRRTMIVCLTDKGLAAVPPRPDPREIFGCLDEEEQEQFRGYLLRIAAHMRQTIGEPAGRLFPEERKERME